MTNSNEVFFLKPELMQTLSSREITLKMDIYAGGISERSRVYENKNSKIDKALSRVRVAMTHETATA